MTSHSLTFNQQTRIAVSIIIEDDTDVLAFSIALVTRFFTLFWLVSRLFTSTRYEAALWFSDLKAAFDFTGKVLVIGFKSLAYGLGVPI